jgi:hypothetical protein
MVKEYGRKKGIKIWKKSFPVEFQRTFSTSNNSDYCLDLVAWNVYYVPICTVISVGSKVIRVAFSASFNACSRNLRIFFYLLSFINVLVSFFIRIRLPVFVTLLIFYFVHSDFSSSFFHYFYFLLLFVPHELFRLFHYFLFTHYSFLSIFLYI